MVVFLLLKASEFYTVCSFSKPEKVHVWFLIVEGNNTLKYLNKYQQLIHYQYIERDVKNKRVVIL